LEEKATNIDTVYVRLLDEGTVELPARPTKGERMGSMVYRLLPTPDYDPEDEHWEFLPGTLVHCVYETWWRGERILLAKNKAG
jgi:hypothetical protein